MQSSPPSPPPYSQHSPEIEHRLTVAEKDMEHVRYRMSLHEKAIVALAGGLYVLFQDRFPAIAAAIRGAIP